MNKLVEPKATTIPVQTAGIHRLSVFPVPQLSAEDAVALCRVFLTCGFVSSSEQDTPEGNCTLNTLKQLFIHGELVPIDDAARAFASLDLSVLIHSGLLHEEKDRVRSILQVQSYQGWIFFSDFTSNEQADDFVLPVGPAGKYLAGLTIRRQFRSALDLGCGCGIQSILAARHCTRVTATDVNPRALALTRLNAALNGISNIETLEGSFFDPVRGRTFDLILANLPYVITPRNKRIYRDTVQIGDEGLHHLIREIPAYLAEGGYAQLLANWIHGKEEPWWQPLRASLARLGVDAWLIYNGSKDPEEYAGMWLEKDRDFAGSKEDRLEWYHDQHIERIALGALVLRRRASVNNWICAAGVTRSLDTPAGEQLARMFKTQDYLAVHPDSRSLLNEVLIPFNMDIKSDAVSGKIRAVSTMGLYVQTRIQLLTTEVIRHLDGRTSLRDALQITGWMLGDSPDQDGTLFNEIQTLLSLGMLTPASGSW